MSDLIPTTQRWVATRRSASQAAGAFLMLTLRRRTWWALVGAVQLGLTFVVQGMIEEGYGTMSRLVWGFLYALVPTSAFCGLCLGAAFLLNRRRMGRRLKDGVVLEATFREHELVLRGPLAESTISFEGIARVRASGDWVFLQQVGSPVWGGWPAALFPRADLDRLQLALATRTQTGYGPSGKVSRTS